MLDIIILVSLFVVGYLFIAFEHKTHIDKFIPALLTGMLMWSYVALRHLPLVDGYDTEGAIMHHLGEIASILFFLMGAMTIVNALDKRGSLGIIKGWIETDNQILLIWLVTVISFFGSAVMDNMTITIVMIAILRKLIRNYGDLVVMGVIVIIAANAGGAWSPMGDVTTTMLWVANKVSTSGLVKHVFMASVMQALFVPILLTIFPSMLNKLTKGVVEIKHTTVEEDIDYRGKKTMLIIGMSGLLFVPIFKMVTHLPPWMGMMISASVVLLLNEIYNKSASSKKYRITHHHLLEKVEWNAILFFLGILSAVAVFQSIAIGEISSLQYTAEILQGKISLEVLGTFLGIASSVIDNVPLVAAGIGMFDFPQDHWFWHYLAYTAGTGGSILIIGSAAGVVAMSLLNIGFVWYMKRFSLLILLSYLLGSLAFFFFM